jgi:hypothetical protein
MKGARREALHADPDQIGAGEPSGGDNFIESGEVLSRALVDTAVEGASHQTGPGPEPLLERLLAARDALLQSQRGLPRHSASWEGIQTLVRDIDCLVPMVAAGLRRSTLFNLNADSGSPVKGRTSGGRQGVLHEWRMEAGHMKHRSIEEFAEKVREKGRIGKYDVQTLRQTLKDGVASRAEADLLIALDREVDSVHFSWPAFFISALTEFAVWNSGRAGYIDEEKSRWLLPLLAGAGATDRGRRALAAIAREAECFDEAFFAEPPSSEPRQPARDHAFQELGLAA